MAGSGASDAPEGTTDGSGDDRMSEQTASGRLKAAPVARPGGRHLAGADRRSREAAFALSRVTVDVAALACAAIIVAAWDGRSFRPWLTAVVILVTLLGYAGAGVYTVYLRPRLIADVRQLLTVSAGVTMFAAALVLAFGHQGAGDAAVRFWLLNATFVVAGRASIGGLEQLLRRSGARRHGATLVVGAGRVGHLAAQRLLADPSLGLRPIGFLDKEPLGTGDAPLAAHASLPVLGASWDLEAVVAEHRVDHVVVAFSTAPSNVVLDVVRRCWDLGVSVMVVPRLYEVEGTRARVEHLGALPIVSLSPNDPVGRPMQVKYALDRVIAGITLLLLSPVFALISLAIVLTSGRPLFFGQSRVGRDGHVFRMLKFRTMSGSPGRSGEFDAHWASGALGAVMEPAPAPEDRRTAIGSLLRRASLDELPQLWNVLRGDMSLIGPRPERLHYVELFEHAIYRYPDRHRVKSGLTGWAQVNGLRGETSLTDRIEWDNFYIENWSPWLDLKILVRTIPALLVGRGAR
jgi:exopolysaccharide biosynthesis polyprenyl glycosylphosphotransferase